MKQPPAGPQWLSWGSLPARGSVPAVAPAASPCGRERAGGSGGSNPSCGARLRCFHGDLWDRDGWSCAGWRRLGRSLLRLRSFRWRSLRCCRRLWRRRLRRRDAGETKQHERRTAQQQQTPVTDRHDNTPLIPEHRRIPCGNMPRAASAQPRWRDAGRYRIDVRRWEGRVLGRECFVMPPNRTQRRMRGASARTYSAGAKAPSRPALLRRRDG